jgi:hypothetical protein
MSQMGRQLVLGSRYQSSRNRLKSDLRLPLAITLCGLVYAPNLGIRWWLTLTLFWATLRHLGSHLY